MDGMRQLQELLDFGDLASQAYKIKRRCFELGVLFCHFIEDILLNLLLVHEVFQPVVIRFLVLLQLAQPRQHRLKGVDHRTG